MGYSRPYITSSRRPHRGANRNWHSPQFDTTLRRAAVLTLLASLPSLGSAQGNNGCISLKNSKSCPAFNSAAISTNNGMIQTYPFLQFVSDIDSFDYQLSTYVKESYVKDKYQNVLGCGDINYTDSSNMYARYTTTVLCNTLIQKSIGACSLSGDAARPLCADSCADFAQSEAYITADKSLCSNPGPDLLKLIRADFTTCSLPDGALTGSCIAASENESQNCGFGNSTIGLCQYCATGGTNSTDTCCYNANAEQRCSNVKLPSITATLTFATPTATSTSSQTETPTSAGGNSGGEQHDNGHKLSGGAIAGIVIGSIAGVALLALALFFCLRAMRRSRGSQQGSIFNQPSPARKGPHMSQKQTAPEGYEVLPGGRVARMAALEGHSGGSPTGTGHNGNGVAGAMYAGGRHKTESPSSSDEYGESPERGNALRPPPRSRRHGSLSSGSVLASDAAQSPTSGGGYSSPLGMASQQSEQLPFFKDYYSQDDIHPSDKVAVLWAYQPRAADELSLERGDMIKVVGIWDDGWATGTMVQERVEEWEARKQAQRDSGVSNTSGPRDDSPEGQGEMKAFPLVCVCLPEHWRKTIEGDASTESASSPIQAGPRSVS